MYVYMHRDSGKESPANTGDVALIRERDQTFKRERGFGSGKSSGVGDHNPFQNSCLENSMDTEESGGLQTMGLQRVTHTCTFYRQVSYFLSIHFLYPLRLFPACLRTPPLCVPLKLYRECLTQEVTENLPGDLSAFLSPLVLGNLPSRSP